MDWLNELDKVTTLSAAGMVFACCIVVGYILRINRKFPNEAIPLVIILVGGLSMLLLSEPRANLPVRIWITRHIIAGFILGFISWMSHYLIISKIEDYLAKRFEVVANLLHIETAGNKVIDPPPPPDKKP